jgi:O-antigen ligase
MDRRVRSFSRLAKKRAVVSHVVLSVPAHVRLDPASAVFFVALALATLFVTARRPAYGIAALVLADPYGDAHYLWWTTITIPKAVLAGVALGLLVRRSSPAVLGGREIRPLLAGGVAIAFVTILTVFPAVYVDVVARESLKALEYLAIFVVAAIAFANDPDETPVWMALGIVTVTVIGSALVQEFTVAPSGLMLFGRVVPRIAGLLEGPNQLAGFFDIVVPLLLARALAPSGRVFAVLVALAVATDVLTFSRAGMIGALAGILAVALREADPRARRNLALGGAVAGVAAAAALVKAGLFSRFLSTSDVDTASGLGSRGELWSAAVSFWRAHPWLGIGAGNFELELPDAGLGGVRTHANSLYLQSLAEGGVALFAANLFALGAAIRAFYVRAPKTPLFIGAGAATIALGAHQVLDLLFFFPKIGGFWWLWLGIAAGALFARANSQQ